MIRLLMRWHRRLGVLSAVMLIWLAISGILINHTESLHLSRQSITSAWLLDWYGLPALSAEQIKLPEHSITQVNQQLFLSGNSITEHSSQLVAALQQDGFIWIATSHHLFWLTDSGELIERFATNADLPQPLQQLSIYQGETAVLAAGEWYLPDADYLNWQPKPEFSLNPRGIPPTPLMAAELAKLHGVDTGLDWQQLLLDLHSGRAFGFAGRLIVDLFGLFALILAISGLFIWLRPAWLLRRK